MERNTEKRRRGIGDENKGNAFGDGGLDICIFFDPGRRPKSKGQQQEGLRVCR